MEYGLDLRKVRKQTIKRLSDHFYGKDPTGKELIFNNYYMELNGKPFMGISGECHYSRVHEGQWEDTIQRMKMGGINIIATYIFWIHHEEEEGKFRFDGNKNIRKFLQLCQKYGMYVIVRIGPFDHGEVRNGGVPDWLYGKPFEVRSANEGFLHYTRILYHKLAEQFEGLYFKDGGPIIGAQIENEYMHSAAQWELTTGVSNEWLPGGDEGNTYMKVLKRIACEEGIITPFYTCTGWGGAATLADEMLPLWGGYAFWPWIFYNWKGEHPVTPEYIYRDNHNNAVAKTYNFEPAYEPESRPYACCEMGGGMTNCYNYRFQLPFESVDAMANIKLASGCNFLGYYMYRGGSNPKGEKAFYLNENQCPKISYDYQAPIGEYGQLRPSYHRLRVLHLFLKNFGTRFLDKVTMLPKGSQEIEPSNTEVLRYAVRTDGHSGFLFLNNYQDHVECRAKKNETITLQMQDETIVIDHISIAAGEEAILPLHMDVAGYDLICAKVQPLAWMELNGRPVYFFFAPEGMTAEYVWNSCGIEKIDGISVTTSEVVYTPDGATGSSYRISGQNGDVEIVTLNRKQSLEFYEIEAAGKKVAVLCDSPILYKDGKFTIEHTGDQRQTFLQMYPAQTLRNMDESGHTKPLKNGIWNGVELDWAEKQKTPCLLEHKQCGPYRYTVQIPECYEDCKDAILQINYQGDIGQAFINGSMISDNFYNGSMWEIGLKEVWDSTMGTEITILITPLKDDSTVDVSSTMAGRMEKNGRLIAELHSVRVVPIQEAVLKLDI